MAKSEKFTGENSIFACRLKKMMNNQGITQLQLAKELNMTRQAVSLYLTGQALPAIDKLLIICEYFNVSSDYLLGITNNPTLNEDIKMISQYTGLSEYAIEKLHNQHMQEHSDMEALNAILERNTFYNAIDRLQEAKDNLEIAKNIGTSILEILTKIPNINTLFSILNSDDNRLGKWFNSEIGIENYQAIINIIGAETPIYLKNYVSRKLTRHNSAMVAELETFFDDESIVDIALMRIDELKQDSQVSMFYAIKLINDLFDYFIDEIKHKSEEPYELILDYFREGAGDDECPQ